MGLGDAISGSILARTFQTTNSCYCYDGNTGIIVKVDPDLYKLLASIEDESTVTPIHSQNSAQDEHMSAASLDKLHRIQDELGIFKLT